MVATWPKGPLKMPRKPNSQETDLSAAINLTAGAIERLTCPAGKQQVFLRDATAPALRVRCTAAGAKSFVFEAKLNRQTIRKTIGAVANHTIKDARAEARRLAVLVDNGQNPVELERQQAHDKAAQKALDAAKGATVGEAWADYLKERQPHWGARHYADHEALTKAGGQETKRGTRGRGHTIAGPLYSFMPLELRELTADAIEAWAATESKARPTQARLGLRCLKAFLNWCQVHKTYSHAAPARNPALSKKAREALGRPRAKNDSLMREQLPAWFAAVQGISNHTTAAYLQALLLVGCRPGELVGLKWKDINQQWRSITIRDKVEGTREVPFTPYVAHLIAGLPRRNEWVFASDRKAGEAIQAPNGPHAQACKVAGIDGLTLHGLRRSFASLTEWLEIPAGVVAQIQGHKPSATAEKHYKTRPLDLLRGHHERVERWVLEQAGVSFDATAKPGSLRLAG